jgi:Cu(I)/Ag(I) efflux system membrane fusion protein
MNERDIPRGASSRSAGAARLRGLVLGLLLLAIGAAAAVRWRTTLQSWLEGATQPAAESGQRKVKYWWDPMMSPPYISDQPGQSPMGMQLVPVYEDEVPQENEAAPVPQAAHPHTTYYCPMHPSYTSDRPGDCPICNMRLVPMKTGEAATASEVEGHANITLDPWRRQLIGVRTGRVERKPVQRIIRAVGRVEYDEKRLASVNLKVGGWVEELFVKSTGEEVKAGDPLFSLYSPDLIEAQRNYLLALHSVPRGEARMGESDELAQATLRSARERLVLLDLSEDQIRELESKQEVPRLTTIVSRFNGVVTRRNVVQGTSIEPGRDLYELADLSTVWLHADVYEYELPLVHVGLEAWLQLASQPGEPLTGHVIFVYPYLNEATRTVRVRVEVPNAERRLKPGMYATAFMAAELGEQLVVDDQAVLDTGTRQIVFVDLGEGRLEPRGVQVGERIDGQIVIEGGLQEGERVVTSGNFLVDSESRLKAALLKGPTGSKPEHAGHGK